MRRIGTVGELDPVVVIKLRGRWVCVDGHHRLAAYTRLRWHEPIRAKWFPKGVREALDHAVTTNEVVKLEIPDADRFEVAWQRVVLGWGSKADIARIADVSERLGGNMRVVKAQYEKDDAFGRKFPRDLRAPLHEVTWPRARMTRDGITPGEINKHEQAVKLAKALTSRMHSKLSEDPEVTARALALYDRYLPQPLAGELNKFTTKVGDEEIPTYPKASRAHMQDKELLKSIERIDDVRNALLRQKMELVAEQDRRQAGGTASDETWDRWVLDAQED
jgi:ParB-like nuclease domain